MRNEERGKRKEERGKRKEERGKEDWAAGRFGLSVMLHRTIGIFHGSLSSPIPHPLFPIPQYT
jgi:hypothetical protein